LHRLHAIVDEIKFKNGSDSLDNYTIKSNNASIALNSTASRQNSFIRKNKKYNESSNNAINSSNLKQNNVFVLSCAPINSYENLMKKNNQQQIQQNNTTNNHYEYETTNVNNTKNKSTRIPSAKQHAYRFNEMEALFATPVVNKEYNDFEQENNFKNGNNNNNNNKVKHKYNEISEKNLLENYNHNASTPKNLKKSSSVSPRIKKFNYNNKTNTSTNTTINQFDNKNDDCFFVEDRLVNLNYNDDNNNTDDNNNDFYRSENINFYSDDTNINNNNNNIIINNNNNNNTDTNDYNRNDKNYSHKNKENDFKEIESEL
jgi:hypothetical protein